MAEIKQKICLHCGKPITRKGNTKYCSKTCAGFCSRKAVKSLCWTCAKTNAFLCPWFQIPQRKPLGATTTEDGRMIIACEHYIKEKRR